MKPSQINAIHRVTLEGPEGVEEELRWFYGDLVGLTEDQAEPQAGELCFRSARVELRIEIRPAPKIECNRRRATVSVGALQWVMDRLDERRIEYTRLSGLGWTDRRISLLDPAGNRVELKQEWRCGVAPAPPEETPREAFGGRRTGATKISKKGQ